MKFHVTILKEFYFKKVKYFVKHSSAQKLLEKVEKVTIKENGHEIKCNAEIH